MSSSDAALQQANGDSSNNCKESANKEIIRVEMLRFAQDIAMRKSLDALSTDDLDLIHQMIYLSGLRKILVNNPNLIQNFCVHQNRIVKLQNQLKTSKSKLSNLNKRI